MKLKSVSLWILIINYFYFYFISYLSYFLLILKIIRFAHSNILIFVWLISKLPYFHLPNWFNIDKFIFFTKNQENFNLPLNKKLFQMSNISNEIFDISYLKLLRLFEFYFLLYSIHLGSEYRNFKQEKFYIINSLLVFVLCFFRQRNTGNF